MDRRHLEYFLAVADHGGFTRASHALSVSQPSLSQAIKTLETELGTELFHRLNHGVQLTPAGRSLIGPAREILRDFAAAETAVLSVADLTGGYLDIASLPGLAADPLAGYVGRFHERFPEIVTRISAPTSEDVLDAVRSGDSEIGLTLEPCHAPDLRLLAMEAEELSAALPPGAPYEDGAVLPVAALESLPLVVTPRERPALMELLNRAGVDPAVSVETTHHDAVLPIALAGAGVALLPPALAAHARRLGATTCRLDPPLSRRVVLASRTDALTPAADAFLRLVGELGATERDPAPR